MARGRVTTQKKKGGSPKVFPSDLSMLANKVAGAMGWTVDGKEMWFKEQETLAALKWLAARGMVKFRGNGWKSFHTQLNNYRFSANAPKNMSDESKAAGLRYFTHADPSFRPGVSDFSFLDAHRKPSLKKATDGTAAAAAAVAPPATAAAAAQAPPPTPPAISAPRRHPVTRRSAMHAEADEGATAGSVSGQKRKRGDGAVAVAAAATTTTTTSKTSTSQRPAKLQKRCAGDVASGSTPLVQPQASPVADAAPAADVPLPGGALASVASGTDAASSSAHVASGGSETGADSAAAGEEVDMANPFGIIDMEAVPVKAPGLE